jgi:hypothetical protein
MRLCVHLFYSYLTAHEHNVTMRVQREKPIREDEAVE